MGFEMALDPAVIVLFFPLSMSLIAKPLGFLAHIRIRTGLRALKLDGWHLTPDTARIPCICPLPSDPLAE